MDILFLPLGTQDLHILEVFNSLMDTNHTDLPSVHLQTVWASQVGPSASDMILATGLTASLPSGYDKVLQVHLLLFLSYLWSYLFLQGSGVPSVGNI